MAKDGRIPKVLKTQKELHFITSKSCPVALLAMEVLTAPPGLEEDVPSAGTGAGAAGAAGAGAGTRRKLFDPHLDQEAIEAGLASGEDQAGASGELMWCYTWL